MQLTCIECNQPFACPTDTPTDTCPLCAPGETLASPPSPGALGRSARRPPAPSRTEPPRTRVGKYEIVETLGVGGMGEVYKARHPQLGHFVAIKVIRTTSESAAEELEQRFRREAQVAAVIAHPGVVRVHDMGHDELGTFMVMEFVEGESLMALMRRECPMDLTRALTITRRIAEALRAAHLEDVIHRDVKPDNVLIDQHGNPRILDFGLARVLQETDSSTLTRADQILGTPTHMAPEQIFTFRDIDHRADVFSLGVTLFQMLTRSLPWAGETPLELIGAIKNRDAPLLSARRPGVPRSLDALLARALTKERDERTPDMQALIDDIDAVLRELGKPVETRRLPSGDGQPRDAGARPARAPASRATAPWVPTLAIAAVLVLAIVAALSGPGAGSGDAPAHDPPASGSAGSGSSADPDAQALADEYQALLVAASDDPENRKQIVARWADYAARTRGTPLAAKADQRLASARAALTKAAEVAFDRLRRQCDHELEEKEFDDARDVWRDFPEGLKTDEWRARVDAEVARVEARRKAWQAALDGAGARRALFDGRSMKGWRGENFQKMRVVDGVLQVHHHGGPQLSGIVQGEPGWRDYTLRFEARRVTGQLAVLVRFSEGHTNQLLFEQAMFPARDTWVAFTIVARGKSVRVSAPAIRVEESHELIRPNGLIGFAVRKGEYFELRNVTIELHD